MEWQRGDRVTIGYAHGQIAFVPLSVSHRYVHVWWDNLTYGIVHVSWLSRE